MSAIEGDLKRAISNAKTYNQKGSEVHDDAEKIRKLVSNSFKDINPAYADPAYTALPTPLPGEPGYSQPTYSHPLAQSLAPGTSTPTANPRSTERPKRSLNLRGPKDPRVRDSQTPTAPAPAPNSAAAGNFVGKTFQQAQEEILQELCELTNEDGELISGNFLQLPSRSLKDYYHTIKTPESLHGLKKKAVGKQGHAEPTGISLMKSWADFENQVSLIWRNARQYNEDGSEISVLAGQLEKHFNKRLAEAKAVIPDPNRPKVKLNMPAKSPPRTGPGSGRRRSSGSSAMARRRSQDHESREGLAGQAKSDPQNFKVRFALRGHLDVVRSVIFTGGGSPSEPEICTAGDDGMIKRFHIPRLDGASRNFRRLVHQDGARDAVSRVRGARSATTTPLLRFRQVLN